MTKWLTTEEEPAWRGLVHLTARLRAVLGRQPQGEHGTA